MLRAQVKLGNMRDLLTQTGLRWLWVSVVVFILDQLTKYAALNYLTEYTPKPVMPFFNLTLWYNHGAAFSLLDKASGWQTWAFGLLAIFISISIVIWLARTSSSQRWVSIGLALIVGGALGNLYDRITYGYVIDFIDWYVSYYHWPIFNIADSAVCVGAGMLIVDIVRGKKG